MDQSTRIYLATEIISEQRVISYRSVARALKVHVNSAKRILYEFHEHENRKKPGSIHATYLLAGTKKQLETPQIPNGHANGINGNDQAIPSSPPPFTSSMLQSSPQKVEMQEGETQAIPIKTITLVREESLQALKDQYETITSIHIYSLAAHTLSDLQPLSDVSRDLFFNYFVTQDPLIHNKTYGVILNPNVRRRTGRRPPISEDPPPKFIPVKDEPKFSTGASTTKPQHHAAITNTNTKAEEPSRPSSAGSATSTSTASQPNKSKPALKRDTSDIFKSFAKASSEAKAKAKAKLEPKGTAETEAPADSQQAATTQSSGGEDTKMTDADGEEGESESEEEALFLDTGTRQPAGKKRTSEEGQSKAERAAKLRKMMDSDDEDSGKPATRPNSSGKPGTIEAEAEEQGSGDEKDDEVAWSDSDTEKLASTTKPKTPATTALTAPARRRGRRKVLKKRTMKDEEGYLVTQEEAVWESFSEDEPAPRPERARGEPYPKARPGPMTAGKGGPGSQGSEGKLATRGSQGKKGAGGKGGGGGGGGGIMSFFGKK